MVKKDLLVQNKTGLHARPASLLAQFCKKYADEIRLITNGKEIDPKSIVALLSAGIKCGTEIEVQVTGETEAATCDAVVEFIENRSE